MVRDNKIIEEDVGLAQLSNISSCYPLHLSFKNLSFDDVLPLLNKVSKVYDIEFVSIRKHKGGSS